jgi:hypothetical protein
VRSTFEHCRNGDRSRAQNAQEQVPRRQAIGYARRATGPLAPGQVAARIIDYGERSGFAVCTVVHEDEAARSAAGGEPGFAALMAEVRARAANVVIVRSPADLSPDPDVRRWMTRMVRLAGCELVIMGAPAVGTAPVAAAPGGNRR